jgi:hypothetical protein
MLRQGNQGVLMRKRVSMLDAAFLVCCLELCFQIPRLGITW